MELLLSPEEEKKLAQIAAHVGSDSPALVKSTVLRLIERNDEFLAAVRQGMAEAETGQLIEEEEMDLLFEAMLRS
jgi:predicted transcriptional regulator